jgi:hypothetical protein
MPRLSEIQEAFAAFLLSEPGAPAPASLRAALKGHAESGLKVYKNNVMSRLIEALGESYPAVKRLVGHAFFRFAAQSYMALDPPRVPMLLAYGTGFADFLAHLPQAACVPYLPDVARLERLYLEAYHAPEAEPLTAPAARWADERARGTLHPSARLMASPFPVSRIWELNRRAGPIEETEIPGEPEHLLVIRPWARVEVRRLSSGAYAMLAALKRGAALGEAFAAGKAQEPAFVPEPCLVSLLRGGTFVSLKESADV